MSHIEYIAHSKNDGGQYHYIQDHLCEVAELMKSFTGNDEFKRLFCQCGLLHDFGKYQSAFQNYIINGGQRGSVPHAFLGASFARNVKQTEIAFAVHGHHKGLPDRADLLTNTLDADNWSLQENSELTEIFLQDTGKTKNDFLPVPLIFSDKTKFTLFERELFTRFLFSALTDADWLNTEKHFNEITYTSRQHQLLDCQYLIEKLKNEIAVKNKDGDINKLRNEVSDYTLSKAGLPVGFYSLGLPTGLGKTLLSVNWALHHALKNNMKRIFIVVPYVTIIDQTAKELKRIFGEQWVLEHHSGYNEQDVDNSKKDEQHKVKLATENWDFPIIVTTTVQFFDSLFSNKPKRCRKIHNIAESVVIFDEVQNLPIHFTSPILSILQNINKVMETSFLFCTATQPAFERRSNFSTGIDAIVPLVSNPADIFFKTRRVNYNIVADFKPVSIKTLIYGIKNDNGSVLSVFNTKKNALNAFVEAKKSEKWDKCYHLSKAMCPDHRKKIIDAVRTELKEGGKRIFVASTQLIEAGVDFDFPCVYREISPLESIIQSAGRCNREGKLRFGEVFIFRLEDSKFPDKLYETLSKHTLTCLQNNMDKLHNYDFFTQYYADIVKLFVDIDKKKIQDARKNFDFETIANCFSLIEDASISIFIANYNQEALDFLAAIKYKLFLSIEDYRFMQQFSVQVYWNFLGNTQGQWEKTDKDVYIWYGSYNDETGICPEPELSDFIQ
ncbi:CRISPR-associated helicase/endonuclease Cas3 [Spirochaetia bacterium]|nr:CRISPR-associated helicase/endonuclease Cas3 [Spirochaetia bacterium]